MRRSEQNGRGSDGRQSCRQCRRCRSGGCRGRGQGRPGSEVGWDTGVGWVWVGGLSWLVAGAVRRGRRRSRLFTPGPGQPSAPDQGRSSKGRQSQQTARMSTRNVCVATGGRVGEGGESGDFERRTHARTPTSNRSRNGCHKEGEERASQKKGGWMDGWMWKKGCNAKQGGRVTDKMMQTKCGATMLGADVETWTGLEGLGLGFASLPSQRLCDMDAGRGFWSWGTPDWRDVTWMGPAQGQGLPDSEASHPSHPGQLVRSCPLMTSIA